jgi:hypothetical protein
MQKLHRMGLLFVNMGGKLCRSLCNIYVSGHHFPAFSYCTCTSCPGENKRRTERNAGVDTWDSLGSRANFLSNAHSRD